MTLHIITAITSPAEITPNNFDVLVCLGEAYSNYYVGNIRFLRLIELTLPRFEASRTQQGKKMILDEILAIVKGCDGRFLFKHCGGQKWVVLSDAKARTKILQDFYSLIEMRNL
ncbi:hypothetical protein ACHAXN_010108 [Cyclotella atomus]